ncbi:hypothetical protein BD560DRAFT_386540, partial [Blakeslea trispora]
MTQSTVLVVGCLMMTIKVLFAKSCLSDKTMFVSSISCIILSSHLLTVNRTNTNRSASLKQLLLFYSLAFFFFM